MKIETGIYVVAEIEKRNQLVQITGIKGDDLGGVLDKNRHIEPVNVSFNQNDVVAVLGAKPKAGSAYGCIIEPYFRSTEHEGWGELHWFCRPSKEYRKRMTDALNKTLKILKKHKLDGFLPVVTEVRNPKGKLAGMYKYSGKDPVEKPDVVITRFADDTDFVNVLLHESGHGVMARLFRSVKGKAAWIKAYHSYVALTTTSEKKLKTLLVDLTKGEERPSDFRGQLEEEDRLVFDAIIAYISDYHSLTLKHLDTLVEAGEDLKDYWPTHIELTDYNYTVTEYAGKSPDELFCECFALHLTGKKLPKSLAALMDKTLRSLNK